MSSPVLLLQQTALDLVLHPWAPSDEQLWEEALPEPMYTGALLLWEHGGARVGWGCRREMGGRQLVLGRSMRACCCVELPAAHRAHGAALALAPRTLRPTPRALARCVFLQCPRFSGQAHWLYSEFFICFYQCPLQ